MLPAQYLPVKIISAFGAMPDPLFICKEQSCCSRGSETLKGQTYPFTGQPIYRLYGTFYTITSPTLDGMFLTWKSVNLLENFCKNDRKRKNWNRVNGFQAYHHRNFWDENGIWMALHIIDGGLSFLLKPCYHACACAGDAVCQQQPWYVSLLLQYTSRNE